ncbi:TetR/AcrR family transcriptional regulator [Janibacter indicus]|uniref:TetR/AcrR family transcriptional regulator n=1 Tax=Janibacter indicus TaxID=857417 RepID=A0A7L9J2T0_9MICO|nr:MULTISPECIES: TetR/AcrR family transcriptional regulator [Janibacter]MCW4602874.1 TetR/AcrR family transcriptional regulator [Janibacter hoylei]QOK23916.1 TetR/AcrR family transcriptional regulator [Janibacter indicus]
MGDAVSTARVGTEPKQDRSRATRQRLLEATVRCLAEHGWTAATVSVIAKEAGISRGALQHHFPTREALVVTALEYMFEERTAAVELTDATAGSGAERVHAVVHGLTELYAGELFRASLQAWTAAATDEQLREVIEPLERRFARKAHAQAVLHLGVDDADPHVRTLIQATLDLARGLALANVLTDDSKRRDRIVRTWSATLAFELGLAD